MNLQHAIDFMRTAHGNQVDLAGKPYWRHPARVMLALGPDATMDEKLVALLHDVLEDTAVTVDQLRAGGFNEAVIEAVVLLTRPPTVTYTEYIRALAATGNALAIKVKLADLADNLNPARPRPDTLTARYKAAKATLTGVTP